MKVVIFAANMKRARILVVAAALALLAASSSAQVPTPEQLNALKSLPPDQQQELIQNVLGSRGDGTNRKTDQKLEMPETIEGQNERSRALLNEERDKTADGHALRRSRENPELRAFDSVLIDLTPYELTPKTNNANALPNPAVVANGAEGVITGAGTAGAATASASADTQNEQPRKRMRYPLTFRPHSAR